jgi:hypothetical protein
MRGAAAPAGAFAAASITVPLTPPVRTFLAWKSALPCRNEALRREPLQQNQPGFFSIKEFSGFFLFFFNRNRSSENFFQSTPHPLL